MMLFNSVVDRTDCLEMINPKFFRVCLRKIVDSRLTPDFLVLYSGEFRLLELTIG